MPSSIWKPYIDYIDNLTVFNSLVGGTGTPYTKRTGTPQGDPFSMMIVALSDATLDPPDAGLWCPAQDSC